MTYRIRLKPYKSCSKIRLKPYTQKKNVEKSEKKLWKSLVE